MDLTAADVNVNLDPRDMDYSAQALTKSYPSITFGDGALKYPALGIPLPDKGQFGMKALVKRLNITQPPDGYEYRYDKVNGTIRIFQSAGHTPAGAVAAPTFTGESYTPAGTVDAGTHVFTGAAHTLAGTNSAPAFTGTPVLAGALVELGNVAIPATTLDLEVIGQ